jgi:hypothetical protein
MKYQSSAPTVGALSLLLVSAVALQQLLTASAAATATVSVTPATGSITIGQPVVVDVKLSTGNQAVAGIDVGISYSANLTFVSADAANSVFDREITPPAPAANKFQFSRVRFDEGFEGSNGQLLRLTFMSNAVGPASINVSTTTTAVLSYDKAEDILQNVSNGSFTIRPVDGPDIHLLRDSTVLLSNAVVKLGSQIISTNTDSVFTIQNTGTEALTLAPAGTAPEGFQMLTPYATSVAPGASTTFTVRTSSTSPGTFSWPLSIASNDTDENPFRLNLSFTATTTPEPDIEITDGVTLLHTGTGTFAMLSAVGRTVQKPIRISNLGSATLTISRIPKAPTPFTVVTAPAVSVAPGKSTTMLVKFAPDSFGTFTWQIILETNIPKKPKLAMNISGTTPGTKPVSSAPAEPSQSSSAPAVEPTSSVPGLPLPPAITGDLCATMKGAEGYNPVPGALSVFLNGANTTFSDVPGDSWYARYLQPLMISGIITGYANADGTPRGIYGGADGLRYDQIAKILALATKQDLASLQGQQPQNASAIGQWSQIYVLAMERLGVGLFSSQLQVGNFASRAEAVASIVSAFGVPAGTRPVNFSDVPNTHPYYQAIIDAANYGIVSGNPDGTFRPDQPLNRAEMAKMSVIAINRSCLK